MSVNRNMSDKRTTQKDFALWFFIGLIKGKTQRINIPSPSIEMNFASKRKPNKNAEPLKGRFNPLK